MTRTISCPAACNCASAVLASGARPGWDYVLIGRPGVTATHPFDQLCDDLRSALESVHA